eukprot:scaffold803_cov310-Pinguiococcus_pyrenoidosus.AAC.4
MEREQTGDVFCLWQMEARNREARAACFWDDKKRRHRILSACIEKTGTMRTESNSADSRATILSDWRSRCRNSQDDARVGSAMAGLPIPPGGVIQ